MLEAVIEETMKKPIWKQIKELAVDLCDDVNRKRDTIFYSGVSVLAVASVVANQTDNLTLQATQDLIKNVLWLSAAREMARTISWYGKTANYFSALFGSAASNFVRTNTFVLMGYDDTQWGLFYLGLMLLINQMGITPKIAIERYKSEMWNYPDKKNPPRPPRRYKERLNDLAHDVMGGLLPETQGRPAFGRVVAATPRAAP
ncbi:MAG: hypothetical protein EB121_07105 [Alphaproteobacteria bacterium]|nr:hypothetical protein [Alphaproteobacteria bacterium]